MEETVTTDSPITRWTRTDVARQLGVSVATVRRMEGNQLHPTLDQRGVRCFDIVEVRRVRELRDSRPVTKADDDGVVAARVFALLRDGLDLRQIVIVARVHPRVVRELYAEWLVTLQQGEQSRREAREEAEFAKQNEQMEREHRAWEQSLQKMGRL